MASFELNVVGLRRNLLVVQDDVLRLIGVDTEGVDVGLTYIYAKDKSGATFKLVKRADVPKLLALKRGMYTDHVGAWIENVLASIAAHGRYEYRASDLASVSIRLSDRPVMCASPDGLEGKHGIIVMYDDAHRYIYMHWTTTLGETYAALQSDTLGFVDAFVIDERCSSVYKILYTDLTQHLRSGARVMGGDELLSACDRIYAEYLSSKDSFVAALDACDASNDMWMKQRKVVIRSTELRRLKRFISTILQH